MSTVAAAAESPRRPSAQDVPPLPKRLLKLRTQLFLGLVIGAGVPLLVTAAVGGTLLSRREDQAAAHTLRNIAVAVGRQVDAHLGEHLDVVREVATHAEAATHFDAATMMPVLVRVHAIHPEFITMLAAGEDASIFAVSPTHDRDGRPRLATRRVVGDREYFKEAMRTGFPFVSGVFLGRGMGQDPIVAVSSPVLEGGRPIGIVEGSLNVARIPLLEGLSAQAPFDVILLDRDDHVVYATPGAALTPLTDVRNTALATAYRQATGEELRHYADARGEHVLTSAALANGGWHVVIQASAPEVRRSTRRFITTMLIIVLGGIGLALLLATLLSRRSTRPLEQLGRSVADFLSGHRPEPLPVSRWTPSEVAELVHGYEELQQRVSTTLSGILPMCAWCRRIRNADDSWESLEAYVLHETDAAVTHGICPDCAQQVMEEARKRRE